MTLIHKPTLRRLAAEGLSQRQIARKLRCSKSAVSMACIRNRVRTCGVCGPRKGSLASIQYLRLRGPVAAAKMGWPQARTRREAELLDALWRSGAGTLEQVLGRRPHTRDQKRAADLRRRGLVLAERFGRRLLRYSLAPGVRPPEPSRGQGR